MGMVLACACINPASNTSIGEFGWTGGFAHILMDPVKQITIVYGRSICKSRRIHHPVSKYCLFRVIDYQWGYFSYSPAWDRGCYIQSVHYRKPAECIYVTLMRYSGPVEPRECQANKSFPYIDDEMDGFFSNLK